MDKHMEVMINRYGMAPAPAAPQMFGNAGREHMEKYGKYAKTFSRKTLAGFSGAGGCGDAGECCRDVAGTKPEHFAKIAWKNHKHSTNNP